eukprot:9503923-Pyramimonas_sp.AAC.5
MKQLQLSMYKHYVYILYVYNGQIKSVASGSVQRNPSLTLRGLLTGTPRRGIASFARTDLKSGRASERGRATSRKRNPAAQIPQIGDMYTVQYEYSTAVAPCMDAPI